MDIFILIHRFINMKNLFVYNGLWKREGIKERLSFYIVNTFDFLKIFFYDEWCYVLQSAKTIIMKKKQKEPKGHSNERNSEFHCFY